MWLSFCWEPHSSSSPKPMLTATEFAAVASPNGSTSFPRGIWGADATVICRGMGAVAALILPLRCSNEPPVHQDLMMGCETHHALVRCVAEVPVLPLEAVPGRSHTLLDVLCSFRAGRFTGLMSEPVEKLRQISIWPNPVPKRRLILKRTGKLNSCGRKGSFCRAKKSG